MDTTRTDARTADARTLPLTSHDLTIAAGYLARSAAHMGIAEANAVPNGDMEAVRHALAVSERLARFAIAIVLGERSADETP